jgi:hypothetical protein
MRHERAWARAVAAGLLVALWAGCTPGADEPADPVWGKQACAHCAMLVSEKPPSSQLTLADGTRHYFDDLGCMAAWLDRRQATPRQAWVRQGEAWVPAATARYAPGATTPMDYGFLPAVGGAASWDEVRAAVRQKERRP